MERRRQQPVGAFARARANASTGCQAGFTFIELMAVIAIIGMLSAIVFSSMDGMTSRGQLNEAARTFGNTVVYIRDLAGLQSRELWIEVDLREQAWRIVDPPSVTDVPDPDDREELTDYGEWRRLDPQVFLDEISFSRSDVETGGIVVLHFAANGELSPSGFVAYFRHEELPEDDGVSVEVTGLTGLVSFHRGRVVAEEIRDADDF